MSHITPVLSIAASDPSGAAGVQADLKTFEARGVYGLTAITALTVQDSTGVKQVKLLEPDFISAQITTLLADIQVNAIKTGLLFNEANITAVAEAIKPLTTTNLVVDPVLVAGNGRRLTDDETIRAYRTHLFPIAKVITPNLLEAELLIGQPITSVEEMRTACHKLHDQGIANVLIKGGHLHQSDRMTDILLYNGELHQFESEHLPVSNPRGTGCTFASCVAAELAKGASLDQAVGTAKVYVTDAIRAAMDWHIGHGRGTVYHGVHTHIPRLVPTE